MSLYQHNAIKCLPYRIIEAIDNISTYRRHITVLKKLKTVPFKDKFNSCW